MRTVLSGLFCVAAVVALLTPVAAAAPADDPGSAAPDPRPNIVVVYTDDQRADDMWVMTRTLELLADAGTTFAHAYAPFPLCCPARATMLTGQYGHNHGVLGNASPDHPLGGWAAFDESSTVATWLDDVGYQTAYVGKYLNKYGQSKPRTAPPGWDDWRAITSGGDYFKTRMLVNGQINQYDGIYQTDLLTDHAVEVIQNRVPADEPLFLMTAYYAPHSGTPVEADDPINTLGIQMATPAVAPRHRDAFAGLALPRDPSFNEADVSDKASEVSDRQLINARLQDAMTEHYQQRLESLLAVDEGVERIVQALDLAGELDNTIIVYTSDNGFMMGEHRVPAGKSLAYEPSAKIPFIVRGPGFPAGATRQPQVTQADLAPTFADIAGATPGLVVDGVSLLPLAASGKGWPNRPIVIEAAPESLTGPMFYTGVRASRYVYFEYGETGEVEFYDMTADPYQLTNLAPDPRYDNVEAQLAALLDRLKDCAGPECRALR